MVSVNVSDKEIGKKVNNITKALCIFEPADFEKNYGDMPDGWFKETYPFIEYLILMTFTGGKGNNEWYTEDEYGIGHFDFAKPISILKTVVRLGMKPFIVIGNIPYAMSSEYDEVADSYGWGNRYEPKDYNLYYDYIAAFAMAIKENFSKEEISTWRFRVGTETDNEHWWLSGKDAYCKLYDYTVAALCDVLGKENVYISFANTENHKNSKKYLEHCAHGTNYYTGEIGTKCDYLSFSHYQLEFNGNCIKHLDFHKLIAEMWSIARQYPELDIKELNVGEGQFLSDGIFENPHRLQMAQDASEYGASWMMDMFIQSVYNDLDYFANWAYAADCFNPKEQLMKIPAYFSAEILSKMIGKDVLDLSIAGETQVDGTVNALAVVSEDNKMICLCNHAHSRENIEEDVSLVVENVPNNSKIKVYCIDKTHSNFFTEWKEIATQYPLSNNMQTIDFGVLGSPFETEISMIVSEECLSVWREYKKEKSKKIHLEEIALDYFIEDDKMKAEFKMPGHSVLFIEITK